MEQLGPRLDLLPWPTHIATIALLFPHLFQLIEFYQLPNTRPHSARSLVANKGRQHVHVRSKHTSIYVLPKLEWHSIWVANLYTLSEMNGFNALPRAVEEGQPNECFILLQYHDFVDNREVNWHNAHLILFFQIRLFFRHSRNSWKGLWFVDVVVAVQIDGEDGLCFASRRLRVGFYLQCNSSSIEYSLEFRLHIAVIVVENPFC